jgi:hypothetical protein
MDLVLMKPGNVVVPEGQGSLVEGTVMGVADDLKDCIELVLVQLRFFTANDD